MVTMNINAAGPGGGNAGRPLAVLFGRTADTNDLVPFRTANYNSLQTQLRRAPVPGRFLRSRIHLLQGDRLQRQ